LRRKQTFSGIRQSFTERGLADRRL